MVSCCEHSWNSIYYTTSAEWSILSAVCDTRLTRFCISSSGQVLHIAQVYKQEALLDTEGPWCMFYQIALFPITLMTLISDHHFAFKVIHLLQAFISQKLKRSC